MENFNIQLHRFHIDTFFETFYESLENRKTYEEKLSSFDFNLLIENQRLNRYLEELKPNLFLDHRLYVDEVKNIILKLTVEKEAFMKSLNNSVISTYKWEIGDDKLSLLFDKLRGNFISTDTTLQTFTFVFSGRPLTEAKAKIEWLKCGKNKFPNKKSITDLIDILCSENIISKNENIRKVDEIVILNTLFRSKDGEMDFKNSNFTSTGKTSEFRMDLENIINSIL